MTVPDETPLPDPPEAGHAGPTGQATDAASDASGPEPGTAGLEVRGDDSPLLYTDLEAPQPIDAEPPAPARWLAFGSVLLGGLLGGLIGYGTGDLMSGSSLIAALAAVGAAAFGALGVGVVAGLTLRAMNEWHAVEHPESETRPGSGLVLRPPPDEPDRATAHSTDPADTNSAEAD